MTNSTWTNNNIKALWRIPDRSGIVYPPCDTEGFMALPLTGDRLEGKVVSVAQFRPEKDHSLQVRRSWTSLLRSNPPFFWLAFWQGEWMGSCTPKPTRAEAGSVLCAAQGNESLFRDVPRQTRLGQALHGRRLSE
jgi:hypothetical protein